MPFNKEIHFIKGIVSKNRSQNCWAHSDLPIKNPVLLGLRFQCGRQAVCRDKVVGNSMLKMCVRGHAGIMDLEEPLQSSVL